MASFTQNPVSGLLNQPSSTYRMRYASEGKHAYVYARSSQHVFEQGDANRTPPRTPRRQASGQLHDLDNEDICKIQLYNATGPARLTVCCVTADWPYHVHPHQLKAPVCDQGIAYYNIAAGQSVFKLVLF